MMAAAAGEDAAHADGSSAGHGGAERMRENAARASNANERPSGRLRSQNNNEETPRTSGFVQKGAAPRKKEINNKKSECCAGAPTWSEHCAWCILLYYYIFAY